MGDTWVMITISMQRIDATIEWRRVDGDPDRTAKVLVLMSCSLSISA
jgi:hypothetical protein